jgi:hypothetical protein
MNAPVSYARLAPNRAEADAFLDYLDPIGAFAFQLFDDDKARHDKGRARVLIGRLDEHFAALTAANRDRCGVYVTINETDGKGRTIANIVRVRKHFIEVDGTMTLDEIQFTADQYGLGQIGWANESSPGKFHVYWNVADDVQRDLTGFTRRQKQLAKLFNSDPSCTDLPRVLRIPGFYHQKAKPFMVRAVLKGGGRS